jgi:tetratricopeptide (TPR) repeat protein
MASEMKLRESETRMSLNAHARLLRAESEFKSDYFRKA